MTRRLRILLAALAIAFLGAHLAALPKTLEDIDSINFALGVEHFDVWAHRPHPPGYPVFIALAKTSTAAVRLVTPGWDRDRRAAAGIAILGVIAGSLAALVVADFWIALGLAPFSAGLASLLTLVAPLFWLTANRPLTDTTGLVAALAVQGWLLRGWRAVRAGESRLPSDWIWAAAGAGLIIGLRSQTLWLTAPLMGGCVLVLLARRRLDQAAGMVAASVAGALTWAVPLVWKSGGLGVYLAAVRSQGSEDLTNIEMLATTPTWRLLSISMRRTFVNPWQERTLAHVVLALAIVGVGLLAWKQRRLLALVAIAFLPYFCFHLAFQETITIRYALPLVVPIAGLAVVALASVGRRTATASVIALAAVSLVFGEPRLRAYAQGSPVFLAFQDMQRALPAQADTPLLKMHHQVWHGVQRLIEWYRPVWNVGPQPFPGDREWLAVVQHFRQGNTQPVWFLAYLPRTDLAAFDPRTTTERARYEFPSSLRTLIGGARLDSVAWWSITQPVWMLGTGWSLTPELAGVTERDEQQARERTAEAFIRRSAEPLRLMIGGRYLGPDNGPPATITVTLDDTPIAEWQVTSNPRWFVRWMPPMSVPATHAGAVDSPPPGAYARLAVHVRSASGGAAPAVGLEQFDARPGDGLIAALTDGWYEQEEDPATGVQWRWTSARSTIETRVGTRETPQNHTLELSGESPLKYFDQSPTVVVRAGDRTLATFRPQSDFAESIAVPGDALAAASGLLTIETSRTFSPPVNTEASTRAGSALSFMQST